MEENRQCTHRLRSRGARPATNRGRRQRRGVSGREAGRGVGWAFAGETMIAVADGFDWFDRGCAGVENLLIIRAILAVRSRGLTVVIIGVSYIIRQL